MNQSFSTVDIQFMRRALALARRAQGKTSPNPMVGAVFVKNGKIIGEGYHHCAGLAHAEVNALQNLSARDIRDGTLYVTLEPCSHTGKTPPCTEFLLQKKVQNVVVAMEDPNPLVCGKGLEILRKNKLNVRFGLLKEEVKALNEFFIYAIQHHLPFLLWRMAFTLDGKIATLSGDSKWISSELSRRYVHRLRSCYDAVLTTSSTVLADDPHLGVRMVKGRDPLRIVIDSHLKTPLSSQVYRDQHVLVATTQGAPDSQVKAFKKAGIRLFFYPGAEVPLRKLFQDLYKQGILSIMTEAGSSLSTALVQQQLVRKVLFFIAPKIMGNGISFLGDLGILNVQDTLALKNMQIKRLGEDIMVNGEIVFPNVKL